MTYVRADYEAAARVIQQRLSLTPKIGLILGSGLAPLADSIENATSIPYEDIPGMPQPGVAGHVGRLVIGTLESKSVLVMQGRAHFYEGNSIHAVGFPVRVMQMLGLNTLIVTNAAGGINAGFDAGDLMLINDHLNLPGMAGQNPLMGANDDSLGPRFPDLSNPYDKKLRQLAHSVAQEAGLALREGVYAFLSGPFFESPAEVRMLRGWGADAVGMSTVPEVLVARHAGMRVMGVSTITNKSIDQLDSSLLVSHEDVLAMSKTVVPRLVTILRGVLRGMTD